MPDAGARRTETTGSLDRRGFVKLAAGAGAVGVAAAAGFGIARSTQDVPVEVIPISYPAIKVLKGSPAPYGLPLIPLTLTASGELVGRPDAAPDQLRWYKYCSHERAPGTEPDFATTDELYYFVAQQRSTGAPSWYASLDGAAVNVADFPSHEPSPLFQDIPGVGAPVRWRSDGVLPEQTITGIVIRCDADLLSFEARVPPDLRDAMLEGWFPLDPSDPSQRFIAFCSFCTHFCCTPGFHDSQRAIDKRFPETVFCTCHDSRFDPFTITLYDRNIFIFPEDADVASVRGAGR